MRKNDFCRQKLIFRAWRGVTTKYHICVPEYISDLLLISSHCTFASRSHFVIGYIVFFIDLFPTGCSGRIEVQSRILTDIEATMHGPLRCQIFKRYNEHVTGFIFQNHLYKRRIQPLQSNVISYCNTCFPYRKTILLSVPVTSLLHAHHSCFNDRRYVSGTISTNCAITWPTRSYIYVGKPLTSPQYSIVTCI